MRPLPPLLLASLLAAALAAPGTAAEAPAFLDVVAQGDAELGRSLPSQRNVAAAYLDANGSGGVDVRDPDEPVYLDLDGSRTVSYGDLRLSPFLRYPAGSVVDLSNRDLGRSLASLAGWFARDGDAWYLDGNADGRVSAGDIRFAAGSSSKVAATDPDMGRTLRALDVRGTLYPLDTKGSARPGPLESWAVDTDPFTAGHQKLSVGDLRLTPLGFGLDDEPTRDELDAVAAAAAPPATTVTEEPKSAEAGTTLLAQPPPGWRTLDWILVVVGVANLAGLVVVGRLAAARHPKNPFR